ncbi:MAG TPA: MgtC/SapB family protein [Tissierellia bacterium]|nr:MgtC/SapB family protein [Tissierellia bacterium]
MLSFKEVVFRLLLSLFLSSIIGLDRESINKPAGLRTHVLVSLASTLIMLLTFYLNELHNSYEFTDRLAAQVISGIGFLGAGTILRRDKGIVTGLTTAASLWAVAAIGLSVGAGFYTGAVLTTILVIIILVVFQRLGAFVSKRRSSNITNITVVSVNKPGQIGRIGQVLGSYNVSINSIDIEHRDGELINIDLEVTLNRSNIKYDLVKSLASIEGIVEVSQYD